MYLLTYLSLLWRWLRPQRKA